jgi:signal transduction histidine kinase
MIREFLFPEDSGGPIPGCSAMSGSVCGQGMDMEDCATLGRRLAWLVRVRWLVVVGGALAIGGGALVFPGAAAWSSLALCVAGLAVANLTWHLRIRWRQDRCQGAIAFARRQIFVDFLLLAFSAHLTGGIASPLVPLFILHGVFSAILLPTRVALGVVGLIAGFMVLSLVVGRLGIGAPVWEFRPRGAVAPWVGDVVRFAFLVVALTGATLQGLDLSREVRLRHKRIVALAAELEVKNAELQRLDDQRVRLLAVASHDLRSPLAAVESHIDLFLDDYLPDVTEAHKGYLRRMKERLGSLRRFINDLLDLTAVEIRNPNAERSERFDLVAQLRDAVSDQLPVARAIGVRIETELPESPIEVIAPPSRMMLAWANLLSNALKYSAGRSPVTVGLRSLEGLAEINFADHGIGMSAEDQASLFQDFYRATAVKQAGIPGSGLGLAIVKRVVEMAGGRIEVSSVAGEGSNFRVTLPVASPLLNSRESSQRGPEAGQDGDPAPGAYSDSSAV